MVGVAAATISYGGDYARTGNMDWGGYGKSLAWTVGGGLVAGGLAKAMGATWRDAALGNAFERAEVEVPLYRTKLGPGAGVGGGRRGYVTQTTTILDKGRTALNVAVNAQVGWGVCGEGAASALHGRLGC